MKSLNLFLVNLFIVSFSFNGTAQINCTNTSTTLTLNFNELDCKDGLYYHKGSLYTGAFYSSYNSNGLATSNTNGNCKGYFLNGKRDGVWCWYKDNELFNRRVYVNGRISSQKRTNFSIVNGEKHVVLN